MNIARFDLEFWLNPLDSVAKYNFGSSCCKPVTVSEMLELTGTDREEFFKEIENMSLHYGWFEGMPRMSQRGNLPSLCRHHSCGNRGCQ